MSLFSGSTGLSSGSVSATGGGGGGSSGGGGGGGGGSSDAERRRRERRRRARERIARQERIREERKRQEQQQQQLEILSPSAPGGIGPSSQAVESGEFSELKRLAPHAGSGIGLGDIPQGGFGAIEPGLGDSDITSTSVDDGGATGSGGGGGSGGGSGGALPSPPSLEWKPTYNIEGAPEWWQGLTPTALTPSSELASLMNSMIPFMSPEDQRATAQQLSRAFPDAFNQYDPEQQEFGPIPTEITSELQQQFESTDRARQALGALTNMAQSAGFTPDNFGPGYEFLRQVLDVQADLGGGGEFRARVPEAEAPERAATERQTRQQRAQVRQSLEPLLGELKGRALQAFQPLVERLTQPGFSAGPLREQRRGRSGEIIPGAPNPRRFT